jgi:hypothetical protein
LNLSCSVCLTTTALSKSITQSPSRRCKAIRGESDFQANGYDRQEYAARLKAAAKEVGVIGDDDSSEEPRRSVANCDLLFPI